MTPADRLKAVTQYKLQKTSSKDRTQSNGEPWTRFVFNTDALLEEEAEQDEPGTTAGATTGAQAGLGAFDFRQHCSAQPHKADDSAHEAAIFGAPAQHLPAEPEQPASTAHGTSSDSDEQPQIVEIQEMTALGADNANNGGEADEPVLATAPKLSWRERAMLKKQQQAGS